MVSHHYLSTPLDQSDRKEGRGKIVPVGLLFCLFAFAVWQVRHALPSYLYAMSVDNGRFDGDNSINITTIDPTHLRLQSKGKASVELTETEEEPHHDETVNNLRRDFKMNCTHNDTASMGDNDLQEELQRILTPIFTPPSELPKLEENDPVKPCRYTFLDLGANVGDSLGKFIDAGFDTECQSLQRIKSRPRYDIGKGQLLLGKIGRNDLTSFAKRCLTELSCHPEDYCYVGVEGNPAFTKRLKEMEARVKGTTPKPIRAAHFYTETVATGVDGPTFLYLDTVNTKQNFWGSSIVETHKDALKSASNNNNVTVKAPVMGLTLTTLLKRSVRKAKGSHVLIKIDIEGGEYPVMNEAIDVLCNYTDAGVRIDMILETHDANTIGGETPDMKLFFSETDKRLAACHVNRGTLAAMGGQRF